MKDYKYQENLRIFGGKAVRLYQQGNCIVSTYFDEEQKVFLASIEPK